MVFGKGKNKDKKNPTYQDQAEDYMLRKDAPFTLEKMGSHHPYVIVPKPGSEFEKDPDVGPGTVYHFHGWDTLTSAVDIVVDHYDKKKKKGK